MAILGNRDGFHVRIGPPDPDGACALAVLVGDRPLWGRLGGDGAPEEVAWAWEGFVQELSRAWAYLILEESYPFNLMPEWPGLLRSEAQRHLGWDSLDQEAFEEQESVIFDFEDCHDLARFVDGVQLPRLMIVRAGRLALIDSDAGRFPCSFDEVETALTGLGNHLADMYRQRDDLAARAAVLAWDEREDIPAETLVGIRIGAQDANLSVLADQSTFSDSDDFAAIANDDNEFLAVARMVPGKKDSAILKTILDRVRTFKRQSREELDRLEGKALEILSRLSPLTEPFREGYEVARWLRGEPGIVDRHGRVDPAALLAKWSVPVEEIVLSTEDIDAIACWGPRHGPAILLNLVGRHVMETPARRATLAHEICHLLIDRHSALPAAEVLGGQVPERAERRARAFAAELLAPQEECLKILRSVNGDRDGAMDRIQQTYNVSQLVARHQLDNAHRTARR